MKTWAALWIVVTTLFLAGCETSGGHLFTYAAQGTQIQAERLVAKVLGQPAKPLPYGGPDIDRPLKRMLARWPQVKAELDKGSVGLTDTGYLAVRDAGKRAVELKKLVREENFDRQVLYRGLCVAVGHGDESIAGWVAYTEDSFATEWNRQAPIGWWLLETEQGWRRKQESK